MQKRTFLSLLSIFLLSQLLVAQHHPGCGTTIMDQAFQLDQLTANRLAFEHTIRPRNTTTYIPVKVHLVRETNGEGGGSFNDALDMICDVNEFFADYNWQFYLSGGVNIINNSNMLNDPRSTSARNAQRSAKASDAMNIFLVDEIGTSNIITVAGYYTSGIDVVVALYSTIRNSRTMPHEIGHFFTLAHPFFGWEGHPFDEEEHGNPVGIMSPNGRTENERVDSSNCTVASDRICDTPADYYFSGSEYHAGACSPFTYEVRDPDSMLTDVMEDNLMSYFFGCNPFKLTDGQVEAMNVSYLSSRRSYLRSDYVPNTEPIVGISNPVAPVGNPIIDDYTSVTLEWNAVENPESYMVEVDIFPSFNFATQRFFTSDTTMVLTDLEPSKRYYWRVRPYGEYNVCTSHGDGAVFRTGTGALVSVQEIAAIDYWQLQPNPVHSKQTASLQVRASESFEADIMVYNTTGQVVGQWNQQSFQAGQNTFELNDISLNSGLYIVSLRSDHGISTKRLLVNR